MKLSVNKSLFFLLPLICEDNEDYRKYFFTDDFIINKTDHSIKNAYNNDINKPWLDFNLFIEIDKFYKYSAFKKDITPIELLLKNKNFKFKFEYVINGTAKTFLCFEIPDKYKAAFTAFIKGNYLNVPVDFKYKILQFWNIWLLKDDFQTIFLNIFSTKNEGNIEYEKIEENQNDPRSALDVLLFT